MKMKKLSSILFWALMPFVLFTVVSCHDDDEEEGYKIDARRGLIVVNEGSYYSHINGSMDFLNFQDGLLERNVFDKVNLRTLGGTPNDAVVCKGKLFVATTDENRIEVMNARNLRAEEPVTIIQPRELCTDGTYVYASSYTGKVYKIDPKKQQVVVESQVVGVQLEGITVCNNFVYVANSCNSDYTYNTNVVKMKAGDLSKVKDITVVCNPNVLETDGTRVFVCSWGDYYSTPATAQQIDQNDQVSTITNAQYMTYHAGNLYMIHAPWGGTTTYQRFNVASQSLSALPIGAEVFSPCNIGVDPLSGDIYVSSLSEDPDMPGSASYTTDGYIIRYNSSGQFVSRYDAGVSPATLLFVNN